MKYEKILFFQASKYSFNFQHLRKDKDIITTGRMLDFIVKSLTQCVPNDKETALALILEANISGKRRAGTGPAPREKDRT